MVFNATTLYYPYVKNRANDLSHNTFGPQRLKKFFSNMNRLFARGIEYARGGYLYFRWIGKPHSHYYRALMNDDVKRGFGELDPVWAPFQLERLIAYGMKPTHKLLDIGCGYLRGGEPIIGYLNEGNYTGADISPDIIAFAQPTRNAKLVVISDNKFCEIDGTFDYIQANSVLTLLDPDQMEELLLNVHKVMHKDSIFLANIPLADRIRSRLWKRYFAYPLEWIERVAERGGLSVEKLPRDTACMEKTDLLRIRLQPQNI